MFVLSVSPGDGSSPEGLIFMKIKCLTSPGWFRWLFLIPALVSKCISLAQQKINFGPPFLPCTSGIRILSLNHVRFKWDKNRNEHLLFTMYLDLRFLLSFSNCMFHKMQRELLFCLFYSWRKLSLEKYLLNVNILERQSDSWVCMSYPAFQVGRGSWPSAWNRACSLQISHRDGPAAWLSLKLVLSGQHLSSR